MNIFRWWLDSSVGKQTLEASVSFTSFFINFFGEGGGGDVIFRRQVFSKLHSNDANRVMSFRNRGR